MTTLPELPPVPDEIVIGEDADGGAMYGQDEDALRAWAIAYAELAVSSAAAAIRNAALEEVAQFIDNSTFWVGPAEVRDLKSTPVAYERVCICPPNDENGALCHRDCPIHGMASAPVAEEWCSDPAGGDCTTCGTRPGLPCPKASSLKPE